MKTLRDAQAVAQALLFAEVRLGDLLKAAPHQGGKSDRSSRGGTSNPLPAGINKKQSFEARLLSDHADIVKLMIVEAERHQDIASRRGVLRAIDRARKSVEKPKEAEVGGAGGVKADPSIDAKRRLQKCLVLLQELFPTDLDANELEVLRELARCIARKLIALFPDLTSPSPSEKTKQVGTELVLEKSGSGCYEANEGA